MGRFNYGTQFDPFYVGNNPKFGTDTTPNSSANDGAYSGITIETTSRPGRFMDVSIARALAVAGWPLQFQDDESVHQVLGPLTTVDLSGDGIPEILFGADAFKPSTPALRTIVNSPIHPDSTALSLFVSGLQNRVLPGLAASNAFNLAGDSIPRRVVGFTLNSGQVYLYDRDSTDVLNGHGGGVGATTPPVICHAPSGSDAVLVGGVGTLVTITPDSAHVDSASAATGQRSSAGPTLFNEAGQDWAAVGYANGVVERFPIAGFVTRPPAFRMGGTPLYLMSGRLELDQFESLVVVSADSVIVFSPMTAERMAGWALDHSVAVQPALADLDGDGFSEIAVADTTGQVMVWNGDGSPALGWPKEVPKPVKDLKLLDLDANYTIDVLALDANGRFHGWNGRGHLLPKYPRALGVFDPVSSLVETFNITGDPEYFGWIWIGTGMDPVTALPTVMALRVGTGQTREGWRYPGHDRERDQRQTMGGGVVAGQPELDHPLLVFPNPAREWVELRFLLDTGETADLEVLDLSGRVIDDARLDLRGGFRAGENAVRWDLTDMAPGLYFCRLERSGSSAGSKVDIARVVVLR
jgi:hypothetical protein